MLINGIIDLINDDTEIVIKSDDGFYREFNKYELENNRLALNLFIEEIVVENDTLYIIV